MTTWLVTGAGGFLGHHVLDRLLVELEADDRIFALVRPGEPLGREGVEAIEADLLHSAMLEQALATARPDRVIHLAGLTPPAPAHLLFRVNTTGTGHLVAALERFGRPVRLVVAGSAAELGPVPTASLPVGEDTPCRPVGAYGLSKWAAATLALQARPPVETVVARLFNPIGPGMPATQVFGRYAAQLAAPGPDPLTMRVHDLDARRDFVDARDVARALYKLAIAGHSGRIYHVGTGRSRPVREGLEQLLGLGGRAVILEHLPTGASPPLPRDSRARIERIEADVGWRPEVPFARSLADHWTEVGRARRLALITPATPV